ncbi:MAG: hypothetical protein J6S63_01300 [Atopobiaceae bacterium]|nr:hypothetical protein [Atopobiaceae bacterium]
MLVSEINPTAAEIAARYGMEPFDAYENENGERYPVYSLDTENGEKFALVGFTPSGPHFVQVFENDGTAQEFPFWGNPARLCEYAAELLGVLVYHVTIDGSDFKTTSSGLCARVIAENVRNLATRINSPAVVEVFALNTETGETWRAE